MANLQKNQRHTVTVEGYSSEGLGITRIDGQVVFVHGGVRGETCVIQILKVLKRAAYARVAEVLSPSPARATPDCPHFPACGGCQLRHITYDEELWFKRQKVADALRRIGGADVSVDTILAAESPLYYRNKSVFPVGPGGEIGFYRARSHQIIPVDRCLLQAKTANDAAKALGDYMARYGVSGYDEGTREGLVRHLFVRTNAAGEALLCVVVNGGALPEEAALVSCLRTACPKAVGILLNRNTKDTNVILGDSYRTLYGERTLQDTLCGHTFSLSVPSFYQVNRPQAERLYGKAMELAGLTGRELVLELYCGAGTITLSMAPHAARVMGAEIVPEAVADAKENAARNGVDNVEFLCADAGEIAQKLAAAGLRPDVVVVDPPRKGLSEDVVDAIAAMAPGRVVYISCNPATLARDAGRFAALGYVLREAIAADLFPRTVHVESIALLTPNCVSTI